MFRIPIGQGATQRTARRLSFGVMLVLLTACTTPSEGVAVPSKSFYFPQSITAYSSPADIAKGDGESSLIYVVNANFDQRYRTGWLSVVDMAAALPLLGNTGNTNDNTNDNTNHADGGGISTDVIVGQLSVPSLGAAMAITKDSARALLLSRGGHPLTLLDLGNDGRTPTCGEAAATDGLSTEDARTDCDSAHLYQLSAAHIGAGMRPVNSTLDEEFLSDPFTLTMLQHTIQHTNTDTNTNTEAGSSSRYDVAAVGYVSRSDRTGEAKTLYSLFALTESTPERDNPLLVPLRTITGGNGGVSRLRVMPSLLATASSPGPALVATDRFATQLQQVSLGDTLDRCLCLAESACTLDAGHSNAACDPCRSRCEADKDVVRSVNTGAFAGGGLLSDIVFSAGGQYAYAASRTGGSGETGNSIIVLDTTLQSQIVEQNGAVTNAQLPAFTPVSLTPTNGRVTALAAVCRRDWNSCQGAAATASTEDLVVGLAFDDNSLLFYRPMGDGLLLERRLAGIGAGPSALVMVRITDDAGVLRHLLVVSSLFDHTLWVVDVGAESANDFKLLGYLRGSGTDAVSRYSN